MTYMTTCFASFFMIVCTKGLAQMVCVMTWIVIMAYFSLVHLLIKNFLSGVSYALLMIFGVVHKQKA
jgi:energy-converting hydrogenase Eha subunit B